MAPELCPSTLLGSTQGEEDGDNMPKFKVEHEFVCHGCAEGKNTRGPFPSSDNMIQVAPDTYRSPIGLRKGEKSKCLECA